MNRLKCGHYEYGSDSGRCSEMACSNYVNKETAWMGHGHPMQPQPCECGHPAIAGVEHDISGCRDSKAYPEAVLNHSEDEL